MKEKLKSWLEKTGYPLELHAYKTVVSHGYICEKSQIYTDIETGFAREIDLVAYLSADHGDKGFFYEIQLLIECKKSEKPLVVLLSENKVKERYEHFLGTEVSSGINRDNGAAYYNLYSLSAEDRAEKIGRFSEKITPGYSIVQGFSKSDENIYKGVMGLSKASEFYRSQYHELINLEKEENGDEEHWFRMQLPILLVDAPLFEARLDENGDLNIKESQWSSILLCMPWVIDRYDAERLLNVQVVQKEFLAEFLKETEKLHRHLIDSNSVYFKENA